MEKLKNFFSKKRYMPTHYISSVIIRTEGEQPLFTLQRKTPGYRFTSFVYNLFPFGGFREPNEDPRTTIEREAGEEFSDPEFADEVKRNLRFYGTFVSSVSQDIHGNEKKGDMEVEFSLYDSLLSPYFVRRRKILFEYRGLPVDEGESVHVHMEEIPDHILCLGDRSHAQ